MEPLGGPLFWWSLLLSFTTGALTILASALWALNDDNDDDDDDDDDDDVWQW
jgi:hypothetical protein